MKKCPICHTQYDDSMNFCVKDGHRLETVNVSQSTGDTSQTTGIGDESDSGTTIKPEPKKKGRILKKIALIVVICLVVFAGVYNYLMNAATYLRLEPNALKATKNGGDCDVDIDYDGYVWEVKHKPNWVSIKEGDDKFNVEVMKNSTGSSREGSITIKSGKQVAQLMISQLGVATYIKASETSMQFRRGGGKKNLGIETDGFDWKATDTPDWVSVSEEKDSLCVDCKTNNGDYRSGYITVSEDNVSLRISLTQGGTCTYCHGEGEYVCRTCNGSGRFPNFGYNTVCFSCGGNGKIRCNFCSGSGYRD